MPFERPCNIRRAGISTNGNAILDIEATDGTFGWSWRHVEPDRTRELLAIALAAIATDKQVNVYIPDPVASANVLAMQLIK